jgi:pyruvate formate lyase activating enzyme
MLSRNNGGHDSKMGQPAGTPFFAMIGNDQGQWFNDRHDEAMAMQDQFTVATRYWHRRDDGSVQCDVCPRHCHLHEGQRGLCFVRACENGEVVMTSYGRSTGFCIDPIEKKPLHHFYPGSAVLSFGTAGCNLACKFCQNWDISKSRETDRLCDVAMPQSIAAAARDHACRSVAFTYNDPVIFMEYAIDCAHACHDAGIKAVAVTAGYICPRPRHEFFAAMDAANIDLKAFDNAFYKRICGGDLAPVLDTLLYVRHETGVWLEITTLLIPGFNDSNAEIERACSWLSRELGPDVPLHFTAFHPDWKMTDVASTPATTLQRARTIALQQGLNYVYVGNVHDTAGASTWCPQCHARVVERDWYRLGEWALRADGRCRHCGYRIAGHFEPRPGTWGTRRQPVTLAGARRAGAVRSESTHLPRQ